MKEMLLCVDIGNTNIECGLFEDEKLTASWRLNSTISRTPDECWQGVAFFLHDADIKTDRVKALAVASVVPRHTSSFVAMALGRFDPDPLVISIDTCPFLDVRYSDPHQVGADRLCNAYAGYHYYGGPLVVVDFGTAITLDVVSDEGAYLGGVIVPGPLAAASVLHSRTAQLPQVSFNFPEKVIGDSTDHAIRAGLTWGTVDMVDGMIERISRELGTHIRVVATGGYAEPFTNRSRNFTGLRPNLVLEGIRLIYEKARGQA